MKMKTRGILMLISCVVLTAVLSIFTNLGLWVLLVPGVYGYLFFAGLVEERKGRELKMDKKCTGEGWQ